MSYRGEWFVVFVDAAVLVLVSDLLKRGQVCGAINFALWRGAFRALSHT